MEYLDFGCKRISKEDHYLVFSLEDAREGDIIGEFFFYNKKEQEANFKLILYPKYQGLGLGYILMDYLTDKAKDLGIKTLKTQEPFKGSFYFLNILKKKNLRY